MSGRPIAAPSFPLTAGAAAGRAGKLPALGAFLLPLALYSATACRDIFWMDSTEFMLAGRYLALSHPPGYPLLLLILRLVSLVPVFSLPVRMNLVSALAAASSCLALFHIVRHLFHDTLAAFLAALAWAVSFELWQQATVLEVYAFQTLIVSLTLLMLVNWTTDSDPRHLLAAAFFLGLGLANHLFIVTLLPGFALLLAAGNWRSLNRRPLLLALGLLLLGPSLYLYVPLRSGRAALNYWGGTTNLPGIVEYLTGRVYRYRFLAGGSTYLRVQLNEVPGLLARQFHVLWLLVIPGAVALWKQHRRLLAGLTLAALLSGGISLAYNIPDKEGYLLPAWLVSAVLIGSGISFLRQTRARLVTTLAVCAGVIAAAAFFYPRQDRSHLHALADLSRSVMSELPDRAVVFTNDYSLFQGIRWAIATEQRDRNVNVVSEHHLAFRWYLDQLGTSLPVPERAYEIVGRLWEGTGRMNDVAFGEKAKAATEVVRYELTRAVLPHRPVFWIPRDFGDWPREWRGYALNLHGLSYQVSAPADSTGPVPIFTFPGPERYSTSRFRDTETQDLCQRFAAAANRRGMLRFERNETAEALADFDLSLAYYPDYSAPLENKGLVYYFTGQPDSAARYLNRFLEKDPQSPEADKVRAVLRRLRTGQDF